MSSTNAPAIHRDLPLTFDSLAECVCRAIARGEKPQVLAVGKGLMLLALKLAQGRGIRVAFLAGLGQGAWFICSRATYRDTDWVFASPGRLS